MAVTKGAKKAHEASERKRIFNVRRDRAMKGKIKEITKLVSGGDKAGANKLLPEAYKVIDKATKRGILKKNTAARKKAGLSRAIKNMGA